MTEVENLSGQVDESEPIDVHTAIQQHLESLRRSGLTELPKGTGKYTFDFDDSAASVDLANTPLAPSATQVVKEAPSEIRIATKPHYENQPNLERGVPQLPVAAKPSLAVGTTHYGPGLGLVERKASLSVLQSEVEACQQCDELSKFRTQTVFGVGNPAARLVFLGEGPGAQEDRKGEPFVGEAGLLLNKILAASQISRSDVYILNTVKCRPPANRNPAQEELANCWGFAERQLEILQPEFICCLGSVAAKTLLKTTQSLGRLRRTFHNYKGSRVLVTYHPAYLLRTPSAKKHVWEDMKMLMKEMGVKLSN